jgi:hypothetical protein
MKHCLSLFPQLYILFRTLSSGLYVQSVKTSISCWTLFRVQWQFNPNNIRYNAHKTKLTNQTNQLTNQPTHKTNSTEDCPPWKQIFRQLVKKFPYFMVHSLPWTQQPETSPYPERNESEPSTPSCLKFKLKLYSHLLVGLQSGIFLQVSPPNTVSISLLPHLYHMPRPPHPPWFNYPNYQSFFIHQLMHKWIVLNIIFKIYIKMNIKTAPTCFVAVTPSSGSALFVLAKVTVVKVAN